MTTQTQDSQMTMPGMEAAPSDASTARCCDITTGSAVRYRGSVYGGPRYGSIGTVTQPLARRAVVDMGRVGTWRIPYYLLAPLREQ